MNRSRKETEKMRDCKTCARNYVGDGCPVWECDYININDAISAYENHDQPRQANDVFYEKPTERSK